MPSSMERFGPTRRGGPVFRWLGEPLAIDLANTVMLVREAEMVDLLSSAEDIRRWLEAEQERLGSLSPDAERHLDDIRQLRDVVRSLLTAAAADEPLPPAAVAELNAASAADPVTLALGTSAEGTPLLIETGGQGFNGFLGAVARSAIRLLTAPMRAELHVCTAPSCGMFFLGNRRWCCSACGNRARVARHYRRSTGRR
jgi:predicted RNA-binding Zn ribbon-like protein